MLNTKDPLPQRRILSEKKGECAMRKMTQRTEAVIRLDALAHNIQNIRSRLKGDCEIMAVLKGDAYGHGLAAIYPTLHANGIRRYAVAIWEEGARLRAAGCQDPILILGDTCDDQLCNVVANQLTPTIFSLDTARKLNALALEKGIRQPVHIKIDTGMSRIGLPVSDASVDAICAIAALSNLEITGAFTHFSRADENDGISATHQLELYLQMLDKLEKAGVSFSLCTDHPVTPIQYLSLSALVCQGHGLSRKKALRAMTLDAAEILCLADKIGSIEPGKDADFALYTRDPLTHYQRPFKVFVNGHAALG